MELKPLLDSASPEAIIFALTSLFAFLSWLIKGLIETPLIEAKATFSKYVEKRIQVLSELKTRLSLIAYFPEPEGDGKKYKEQIQDFILTEGNSGYLNKSALEAVIKIAITPETDEKLLLGTIKEIEADLYDQISKIQDEIKFYRKFSNYSPVKRFVGFAVLGIQYLILFVVIIFLGFTLVDWLWMQELVSKVFALAALSLFLVLVNKWMLR